MDWRRRPRPWETNPRLLGFCFCLWILTTTTMTWSCDALPISQPPRSATSSLPDSSQPMHKASSLDSRSLAVFALMESRKGKHKQFSIRVLERHPAYTRLEPRDRAFARLLLSTVERRSGQINKVLQSFMAKRSGDDESKTQQQQQQQQQRRRVRSVDVLCNASLQIGAAQLLFLDVSVYAAVSETVEVLRKHPKIHVPKPQISFVNAVLRSVDRMGRTRLEEMTSVLDNVDPWLRDEWIATYGLVTTHQIVETAMSPSPIFVSVNQHPEASFEERQQRLEEARKMFSVNDEASLPDDQKKSQAELLPHGSIGVPVDVFGGIVSKWPLYEEGAWWVQDPSATLPALALERALGGWRDFDPVSSPSVLQKMHVVDLCSAPGGKTAQLCSMGFGTVSAVEISPRRSRILKQNLNRLGMLEETDDDDSEGRCRVVVQDGCTWLPLSSVVDGVLVDAPCSASGVASRQPDVLQKSFDNLLPELMKKQRKLAAHAADKILQPGGILVYATCSLLKQEGEDQAQWLLARGDKVKGGESESAAAAILETVPFLPGEIPGFDAAIDENGFIRVIPGTLPGFLSYCDGFFVARMKRVA